MSSTIPIGPWPKGVNLIDSVGTLESDELSKCENYRLNPVGYPYKRPGHSLFGSGGTKINGDHFLQFLHRLYTGSGSKILMAIVNGKFFTIDDTTGASSGVDLDGNSSNSMSTTALMNTFTYKDRIYILDGTKAYRYNGSVITPTGFPGMSSVSNSQATGGSLTTLATYKYKFAPVCGNMGEGPASGLTTITMTGSNNKNNLSVITQPNARYECSTIRIYRTNANGSDFYFLTELAFGVTTYSDGNADTALGSKLIDVHNAPPTAKFAITGYDDRTYYCGMTGADASLIDVSDVGWPDRCYDNENFTVANNNGDILTAVGRVPAGVVFFKRKSMWLLRSFNSGIINISPEIGTTSPLSVIEVPGGLIFLSTRGEVYLFDGVNLTEIGRRVKPEFVGISSSAAARVVACYHDFRYHIAYDYRGTNSYNSRVLEYDLVGQKWDGPHYNGNNYNVGYFCVFDSERDYNELLWGEARAASGSYIYIRNDSSLLDRNAKFTSALRTGQNITFQEEFSKIVEKTLTVLFVKGRFTSDTTLSANLILDDEITKVSCTPVQADISQSPLFGKAIFGTDKFTIVVVKTGRDNFGIDARGRALILELFDGGTSTDHGIEEINALGKALPLK